MGSHRLPSIGIAVLWFNMAGFGARARARARARAVSARARAPPRAPPRARARARAPPPRARARAHMPDGSQQDDEATKLFSMDLDALSNTRVTTASKFAEKLSARPAICRW